MDGKFITRSCKKGIKNINGNKEIIKYNYYACNNASNGKKCICIKKSHKSNLIEEPVLEQIYTYLEGLKEVDLYEHIKKIKCKYNEENELKKLKKQINKQEQNINLLKAEVIKVLNGESEFNKKILSELIEQNNVQLKQMKNQKIELEKLILKKQADMEQMSELKQMIPNWKEEFINADIATKKILLSTIIKQIVVYDEKIEVELRINIEEFIGIKKREKSSF